MVGEWQEFGSSPKLLPSEESVTRHISHTLAALINDLSESSELICMTCQFDLLSLHINVM
jgi:hypothetical protein